jgi:hypothetical protein
MVLLSQSLIFDDASALSPQPWELRFLPVIIAFLTSNKVRLTKSPGVWK